MGTGEFNAGANPIQKGVEILLVTSCDWNQDKLQPDEPLGLYADFMFSQLAIKFNYYLV